MVIVVLIVVAGVGVHRNVERVLTDCYDVAAFAVQVVGVLARPSKSLTLGTTVTDRSALHVKSK